MLHASERASKYCGVLVGCVVVAMCATYVTNSLAQSSAAAARSTSDASPVFGVTIPPGYRDWKLIAVDRLKTDKVDQLRAQLGNDIAIKAFKEGKVPFPDGSIIAALHWTRVASEGNNKVLAGPFPGAQSPEPTRPGTGSRGV